MGGYFDYYYLSNYYYIILVLPMIVLSMIASARVNSSFKKYSKVLSSRRLTGAQAAFETLRYYGITNVKNIDLAIKKFYKCKKHKRIMFNIKKIIIKIK